MTARISTGLTNGLADKAPLRKLLAGGFLDIFTGTQPATADAAATGTRLATIYSNGTSAGLDFDPAAVAGVLSKLASQTWSTSSCAASGTAGYFRFRAANDPGAVAAGGTVTVAARAANSAVIVFTDVAHGRAVGDIVNTKDFTGSAYNVHGAIVAITTDTFSVISDSIAGGSGDAASVMGTYTYSVPTADTGLTTSSTAVRFDGAIGTSGAEMNLGSLVFTATAPFVMATAALTLPMA